MDEALSSLPSSEALKVESIAKAMLLSNSIEELLQIFLNSLGEILSVNRVAIYHFINQQEGKILVEAISPNCQSIKDKIYPIAYFGISSVTNYPCDRAIVLPDIAEISGNPTAYQGWQRSQVKAMMSAPILFDSSTSFTNIWGLAVVQQCDRPRQWQPKEANILLNVSQVLSKCLQAWELRLQLPIFSQSLVTNNGHASDSVSANELEEFIVERVELSQDTEIISTQPNMVLEEMTVASDFVLADDDENEILDKIHSKDNQASINLAVNFAMQRLDWEMPHSSSQSSNAFTRKKYSHVDVESVTLKDVLESCTQDKVEYLQQRVNDLTESLQQKFNEIEVLHEHIQELTESQKEFRRILGDLQSKNLLSPP